MHFTDLNLLGHGRRSREVSRADGAAPEGALGHLENAAEVRGEGSALGVGRHLILHKKTESGRFRLAHVFRVFTYGDVTPSDTRALQRQNPPCSEI